MPVTACPFCFTRINSSRLAHQCTGQGPVLCRREKDEARERMTGNLAGDLPDVHSGRGAQRRSVPGVRGPGSTARLPGVPHCAAGRLR